MLTLEQIQGRLIARKTGHIVEHTGLSVATIWRIRNGSAEISYSTYRKLNDYLEKFP